MEVLADQGPEDGHEDGSSAKDHGLNGRRVLGGEAEGCGVLVVDLVDVFVERPPVQRSVHPVVPCILEYEEEGDLRGHGSPGRKRHVGPHAARHSHRVEEPDL